MNEEGPREHSYAETPLSYWLDANGYKIKGPDDLMKGDLSEEVCRHIKGLIETSRDYKSRSLDTLWLECLYFVFGVQHIDRDDIGRWAPADLDEDQRRVRNIILPRAQWLVSQILKTKPVWDVTPAGTLPEQTQRAHRSARMLRGEWERQEILPLRTDLAWSQVVFGSAIIKDHYDPRGGPLQPIEVPLMDGAGPVLDESGQPQVVRQGYKRVGDIVHEEVLPFHFHVPLSARNGRVNELDWCAETTPKSLVDIWRTLRVRAKPDITGDNPTTRLSFDWTRLSEGPDALVKEYHAEDLAEVFEYHEKPNEVKGFEKGIKISIVGNKVEAAVPQQLPEEYGYVYGHFIQIPRKSQFWGHSVIRELLDSQRDYNEDRRVMACARDLGGVPPIAEPIGSNIPEAGMIRGMPRRIKYTGQPPSFMAPPPLNPALIQDIAEAEKDMDRLAQQFAPTRGENPGASPWSRDALEFMREQQETVWQPMVFLTVRAFSEWGARTLQLIKDYVSGERIYQITGDRAFTDFFSASSNDIPEKFLVTVQEQSALPLLKAAMRQEVLNNVQVGLYGPPEQLSQDPILRVRVLRAMQTPIPSELMPPEEVDWDNAMREAERLLENDEAPMMSPMEDKTTHIRAHTWRAKQPDFKHWAPDQQKVFLQHIEQTKAMLEQEEAQAREKQFNEGVEQGVLEMIRRGKVSDAEALLLSVRGIIERLGEESQAANAAAQQQQPQPQGVGPPPPGGV